MIRKLLTGGVVAGFAAGLLGALLHFAFIQELILLGEEYESGARVHFQAHGEPDDAGMQAGHDHGAHDHSGHDHGGGDGEETSTIVRNGLTVLFTGLIYAGYGLILVAGFALAEHFGRRIGTAEAILWGIAGFVSFQLAPAMGLAPELPGSVAADLGARQAWWLGTVIATAGGIALLAYGRGVVWWVLAGALLAAPHVIGAPHLDEYYGVAPPEVAAEFAARVLGVGLVVWTVLGWLAGSLWQRESA
ncbi:cobalt transporter subunit CbtA [Albidovulum inexpectatum]|uniref:Cobalt transporter subunit CbtA n=1 Tax=Albidovulum inexpectatum TaxID=196587 RepID=A0A2S5JM15_9RHOB|nr:CbtA family protein [Albidovulum inexpectatum]PPB82453.1 cobalt transporter subunit CbtA [Albidovulum inexpectatum]